MTKVTKRWVSAFAVGTTIATAGAVPAFADNPDDTLAVVASATPETIESAASVPTTATGENAIDATVAGATVTVPVDASNGITLGSEGGTVSIGLPFADQAADAEVQMPGVVSFDNRNGSSPVPVVQSDGSVQINTIIEGADAPTSYSYDYDCSGGVTLRRLADGGIVAVDGAGELVASIALPWAKDARGKDVATRYVINGTTLTQIVEHGVGSAYPIVADPTTLGSNGFYTKIVQNSSSQGTIISVYPAQIKWNAYSGDTIYANYKAIVPAAYEGNKWRDQLVCHAANVGIWKTPWNLDSWRPDVGYARTVLAACNP